MTKDIILANARLILPDSVNWGTIVLRDGRIHDVSQDRSLPVGALDCDGSFIAPGLIELHTDNLERHMMPRPKVDWPHSAAIVAHDREMAGTGITTVFDAIRAGSIVSQDIRRRLGRYARGMVDELHAVRAAGALKISHHIHLRAEMCSETLCEELDEFDASDRIGILSLMDHTPGQRQFRDLQKYEDYVCGKNQMPRENFEDYIAFRRDLQAKNLSRHETAAISAAARLGATLASHDDTTGEQVQHSCSQGVTVAEFPTTREAADACHTLGLATVLGAPNLVRGSSHSGNVAALELAKADRLDILSSDYVPAALLQGAIRLGVLWKDMARGLATVTRNPARTVGLSDRGCLETGLRADLVMFDILGQAPVVHAVWSAGKRVA